MTIDLANMFKAIGPAASIIFAAWIFMGFLQTRYDAAVDRYRTLVSQYRDGDHEEDRRSNLHDEILVYKWRCDIMNIASVIGLASAIILVLALMIGELALIFPKNDPMKYASIFGAFLGLALVVVASGIVMYESLIIHRQLASELLDLPSLARESGQKPGKITDDAGSRESSVEKQRRA